MSKGKHIEEEISKDLEVLEQWPKERAGDSFEEKLLDKIAKLPKPHATTVLPFYRNPMFRVAAAIFLLLVNSFIIVSYEPKQSTDQDEILSLMQDYGLSSTYQSLISNSEQ